MATQLEPQLNTTSSIFTTSVQRDDDEYYFPEFFRKYFIISLPIAALYIWTVFKIRSVMKERKKFELRFPLFLWSSGLAILSLYMFLGILINFLTVWRNDGFHHSLCEKWFYTYPTARYWAACFTFSKILEFGDTIFIVLRKQHLSFLHAFHHSSALILCWYTGGQGITVVCYFAFVNTFVHVIMYSYFALKALRVYVPKYVSVAITSSQMIQMVFGVCIASYVFKLYHAGKCNAMNFPSFVALSSMYVIFFVLFAHFFYQAYLKNSAITFTYKRK